MRKFTKILAVFMIACLLCGIVAMSISAAEDSLAVQLNTNHLDIKNDAGTIQTLAYEDFSSSSVTSSKDTGEIRWNEAYCADTNVGGVVRIVNLGNTTQDWFDDHIRHLCRDENGNIYTTTTPRSQITDTILNSFLVYRHQGALNKDKGRNTQNYALQLSYNYSKVSDKAPESFPDAVFLDEKTTRYSVFDFDFTAYEYRFKFLQEDATYDYGVATEILEDENGAKYALFDRKIKDSTGNENFYEEVRDAQGNTKYKYMLSEKKHSECVPAYYNQLDLRANEQYVTKDDESGVANATIGNNLMFGKGLQIKKDSAGKFYATMDTSANPGTIYQNYYLPEEPGVWTHFTAVREVKVEDATSFKVTYYWFADGNYIGHSFTSTLTPADKSYGISFKTFSKNGAYTNEAYKYADGGYHTAIAFDNISYTAYKSGYESSENGLGAYISGEKYQDEPLYNCDDVVYNKDTFQSANYFYIEDAEGTTQYKNLPNLLENIKKDDSVYSPVAIEGYMPPATNPINNVYFFAPIDENTFFAENYPAGYEISYEDIPGAWKLTFNPTSLSITFKDVEGNLFDGYEEPVNWKHGESIQTPDYSGRYSETSRINPENGDYEVLVWTYQDPFGETKRFDEMSQVDYENLLVDYSVDVTLAWVVEGKYAKVTWKNLSGGIFKEEWFEIDSTVAHPTVDEMKAVSDFDLNDAAGEGWYDRFYTEWKAAEGYSYEDKITANTVFEVDTAGETQLKADIAGIQYSFALAGDFQLYIYAPIVYSDNKGNTSTGKTWNGSDVPAYLNSISFCDENGVNITKAYRDPTLNSLKETASEYRLYDRSERLNANSLNVATVYLKINVTVDGATAQDLIQEFNIDLVKYVNTILTGDNCGSEEAVLALSMIQYVNENYKYANGGASLARADEVIGNHTDCACKTAREALYNDNIANDKAVIDDAQKLANAEAAEACGILGIQFYPSLNQPTIRVFSDFEKTYLNPDLKLNDVKDKTKFSRIRFIAPNLFNDSGYTDATYGEIVRTDATGLDATEDSTEDDNVHFSYETINGVEKRVVIYKYTGLKMALSSEKIVIQLRNSNNGLMQTMEYSLAEYIEDLDAMGEDADEADVLPAMKAMYILSKAAKDYKILSQ